MIVRTEPRLLAGLSTLAAVVAILGMQPLIAGPHVNEGAQVSGPLTETPDQAG